MTHHLDTQKGNREQQEVQEVLHLPSKCNDDVSDKDDRTHLVQLERVITSWSRIPTNGPHNTDPRLGTILVISMTIVVVLWFTCGFIWLFMTGDSKILELSTIAVGAFVAALGYRKLEMSKGHRGTRYSSQPSSSDEDAELTPQEER